MFSKDNPEKRWSMALASLIYDVNSDYICHGLLRPFLSSERTAALDHCRALESLGILKGAVLVFDRGYYSEAMFRYFSDNGYLCVMRLKEKYRLAKLLSADLSSLPTIILRRFLFTNDPAYLLLSVALGDVFLLPPPLLCGILFTLHKKKRKSVPDQSFALSHHTNSSWGATLVSFLMHLPQLLHCYDTGTSDLYQVKPTALF
jgi:hypothetical protein